MFNTKMMVSTRHGEEVADQDRQNRGNLLLGLLQEEKEPNLEAIILRSLTLEEIIPRPSQMEGIYHRWKRNGINQEDFQEKIILTSPEEEGIIRTEHLEEFQDLHFM